MGRKPCCEKIGLNRGPWTIDEDQKLTNFIFIHGIHCWRLVPKLAGLKRCGKSCRLRWVNYLRPDLNRQAMSMAEEDQIIELHSRFGNRWSKIATHFPGRTDNEIKNYWNTRIKKKLKLQGVDPRTHKQKEELQPSSSAKNNLTIETANQKKEPEETSESGSLNQSTSGYSTAHESEILWQSFEMEASCSTSASSQETKGVPIQEEDVQNWIDCLESLLSSDSDTNRF